MRQIFLAILLNVIVCHQTQAEQAKPVATKKLQPTVIRVAVAANFRAPLEQLIDAFQANHRAIEVKFSSGSSGSLYHQIIHGAPFDVFLSADSRYPRELEKNTNIKALKRRTYALGELVLFSPQKAPQLSLLKHNNRVALANPKLAPYGRAAREVMHNINNIKAQSIVGQSIAQAYQYAVTGNVDAAFVAKSMVLDKPELTLALTGLYQPIEQQSVLLPSGNKTQMASAEDFYQFLFSDQAQRIIQDNGYGLASGISVPDNISGTISGNIPDNTSGNTSDNTLPIEAKLWF